MLPSVNVNTGIALAPEHALNPNQVLCLTGENSDSQPLQHCFLAGNHYDTP